MSRQRDLNPRPLLYKSTALPLSYVGFLAKQTQQLLPLRMDYCIKEGNSGQALKKAQVDKKKRDEFSALLIWD
jgi:hypothetical protein